MKVKSAQETATEWVTQNASQQTGFLGAYFSGSTVGQHDEELSPFSDVDVMVVITHDNPPLKLGKFLYRGTLLDVTYLSWNQLASVDEVLSSCHLPGSFRVDNIIADPNGQLRRLQTQVSRHFSELAWVRRRCANVRRNIEAGLRNIDISAPWHDQVNSWLFPTGITTFLFLLAALRNPTVRRRYLAAREVLIEFGHASLYPELLKLLGCTSMSPQRVEHHLDELARTFDFAAAIAKTPFFFSTDITASARHIAIDGSRKLIDDGDHQEAVFWIVATFARCQKILAADASPNHQRELAPAFDAILADLGISSTDDLIRRGKEVILFLPKLWETTEAIMSANPSVTIRNR